MEEGKEELKIDGCTVRRNPLPLCTPKECLVRCSRCKGESCVHQFVCTCFEFCWETSCRHLHDAVGIIWAWKSRSRVKQVLTSHGVVTRREDLDLHCSHSAQASMPVRSTSAQHCLQSTSGKDKTSAQHCSQTTSGTGYHTAAHCSRELEREMNASLAIVHAKSQSMGGREEGEKLLEALICYNSQGRADVRALLTDCKQINFAKLDFINSRKL